VLFRSKFGAKRTSSLSTGVTSIFEIYAFKTDAIWRGAVNNAHVMIESTNLESAEAIEKHYMQFLAGPYGETWDEDDFAERMGRTTSVWNDDEVNNWIGTVNQQNGLNWSLSGPASFTGMSSGVMMWQAPQYANNTAAVAALGPGFVFSQGADKNLRITHEE
jgi:hypothetical protein